MKKLKAIFEFEVEDDTKDVVVQVRATRRIAKSIPGRSYKIYEHECVEGIVPQLIKVN